MQMTMRWFGPQEDKIPLEYIRQVPGVEGVVGALYDVAPGEVWPVEKIKALVDQAHAAGLTMEVIESVNIHDDIKIGTPARDRYIENYKQTIRNLAGFGVKVICYNFMPVFDWMKTDMNYVLPDGSLTMAFEKAASIRVWKRSSKRFSITPTVLRYRDGSPSGWLKCRSCSPAIAVSMILSCGKICFISSEKLSRCARKWG
jgi:mannonate dehydratase